MQNPWPVFPDMKQSWFSGHGILALQFRLITGWEEKQLLATGIIRLSLKWKVNKRGWGLQMEKEERVMSFYEADALSKQISVWGNLRSWSDITILMTARVGGQQHEMLRLRSWQHKDSRHFLNTLEESHRPSFMMMRDGNDEEPAKECLFMSIIRSCDW